MALRYWVGGTNTWNATATGKWSTTSGGAAGAAVPTAADDVIFDANSGSGVCTIGAASVCRSLNTTGFTGTIAGTSTLGIGTSSAGNFTIGSGTTWSYTGTLSLVSTVSGNVITTNGKTLNNLSLTGAGGGWTMGSALTVSGTITHTRSTLNTGNYALTCGSFNTSNSNARTLTLGSSTFTLTAAAGFVATTATNLTLNAGTSTMVLSANSAVFASGSKTFYNVEMSGSGGSVTGTPVISNNFTLSGTGSISLPSGTSVAGTFTTASTKTITINSILNISGSADIAGPLIGSNVTLNMNSSTTGKTLKVNNASNTAHVFFNNASGGWTLTADIITTGQVTLTAGAVDTANYNITAGFFRCDGSNVRSLTLGSSTLTIGYWVGSTVTNFTLNAGTSTIVLTNNEGTGSIFGLKTLYNITSATGSSLYIQNVTISNMLTLNAETQLMSCTINHITLNPKGFATAYSTNPITIGGDIIFNGNAPQSTTSGKGPCGFKGLSANNRTTVTCNGTISGTYAQFTSIAAAGSANWNLSSLFGGAYDTYSHDISFSHPGSLAACTGITFSSAQTVYWYSNGGRLTDAKWYTATNGGGSVARAPLPFDTAIFDANSFSSGSQTVIVDLDILPSIDFSAATNSPTINGSGLPFNGSEYTATASGDFILNSSMTVTNLHSFILCPTRSNVTLNAAGKNIASGASDGTLSLGGYSANTVTLGGDVVASGRASINTNFDANGYGLKAYVIELGRIANAAGSTCSINMGSGVWEATGNDVGRGGFGYVFYVWGNGGGVTFTVIPGTSTVKLSDTTSNPKTILMDGSTSINTKMADLQVVGGGSGKVILIDGGAGQIWRNLNISGPKTLEVTMNGSGLGLYGSTLPSGSAGNLVNIISGDGQPVVFYRESGSSTKFVGDYMSITNSIASTTGGVTWYAGANSVDGGSNTGWTFTAGPPINIAAPFGTLTVSGYAPGITALDGPTILAPYKAYTFNTFIPGVGSGGGGIAPVTTFNQTKYLPSIASGGSSVVPLSTMTMTKYAPSVKTSIVKAAPLTSFTQTKFAIVVGAGKSEAVPLKTLTLNKYAPMLSHSANVFTPTGTLTFASYQIKLGKNYNVPSKAFTITKHSIVIGSGKNEFVPLTSFVFTKYGIMAGTGDIFNAPLTMFAFNKHIPSVGAGKSIPAPHTLFNFDALAPEVGTGVAILPDVAPLTLTGHIPDHVGERITTYLFAPVTEFHMTGGAGLAAGKNIQPPVRNFTKTSGILYYKLTTVKFSGEPVPQSHLEDALKLDADAYIDLFQIILSDKQNKLFFTLNKTKNWQGNSYEGNGIKIEGVGNYADDEVARPRLSLWNPEGVYSYLIDQGLLDSATIVRYRVLKQHIDADLPIYRRQQWRVSRVASVRQGVIALELRDMLDGQMFQTPGRMFIPPDFPTVSLS